MLVVALFTMIKNWKHPHALNLQSRIYPCERILLVIKRNKLLIHTTWMSHKSIPVLKGYVLYDPI